MCSYVVLSFDAVTEAFYYRIVRATVNIVLHTMSVSHVVLLKGQPGFIINSFYGLLLLFSHYVVSDSS